MIRSVKSIAVSLVLLLACAALSEAHAKRGRTRRKRPRPPVAKESPESPETTAEQEASRRTVAVMKLGALGVSSDMMKNLEMLLRNSIDTIPNVEVISSVDVQIALQDPKNEAVANCGGGTRCAAEVGKLVGAETVVFGSIGRLGEAFDLNLRAVDVGKKKEIARQQTSISGSRDLLIPEMRLAAFRLIAPDRIRGSLLIEIDVEGVEIEIDGKVIGVTPIAEPVDNLKPGPHVVLIRRPGYSQFQQEFEIRAFETARLKLDLKKAQKK